MKTQKYSSKVLPLPAIYPTTATVFSTFLQVLERFLTFCFQICKEECQEIYI